MTLAPVYARGVSKVVSFIPEATFGVQGAGTAQSLRRVTADFNLVMQPINSQEITQSGQARDMRLGPRQVQGTASGQLSAGSYATIFAAILRGTFIPGPVVNGITDSVASVDGATGRLTITSPSSHFVTAAGYKVGDIVRLTGLTGGPAADLGENLRIIGIADNVMTFAPPPGGNAVWSTGQTDGVITFGKKLITPTTVATQIFTSFSIEQWYGDVGISELFTGVRFTQASLNVPASGFATFQVSATGRNMTVGAAQVYTNPTQSASSGLTAAGGKVSYQGNDLAIITGMSLQIAVDTQADPVVGSQFVPEIFQGMITCTGSFQALMTTDGMTADFINENEVTVSLLLTDGPSPGANFFSVFLPRVKLSQANRADSPRAIIRNYSFVALEQLVNSGAGGIYDDTTVTIQDSLA